MIADKYGNLWPTNYDLCPECKQPDNCGDCNHGELTDEQVRELGGVPGDGMMTKDDAIRVVEEVFADYFVLNDRNSRISAAMNFVCDVAEEHSS